MKLPATRLPLAKTAAVLLLSTLTACGPKKEDTPKAAGAGTGTGETASKAPPAPVVPDLKPIDHPAAPAEAAKAVDLAIFPIMSGAEETRQQSSARLAYRAGSDVKSAYEFQKKNLTAQRWKELPDASVTNDYASGAFTRAGFTASVSVMPASVGKVDVLIHNHGNVNLAELPLPPGTKPVYVGPVSVIHSTETPAPATAEACRGLLTAQGWEPYGSSGDSAYFKRNAIKLHVTVQSPRPDETMITYFTEQMAADIPAPLDVEDLRYSDTTRTLTFQSPATRDAVVAYYKETLAKSGWKANKDVLTEIDERDVLVFRNAEKDLLSLAFTAPRDGREQVTLTYQSGAEIDEMNRKLDAQRDAYMAKKKAGEAAAAGGAGAAATGGSKP